MPSELRDQVKLPMSVAFEVVMQGIRIRLGRSVVTLMGVLLGIAFLMSILAGQVIRQGVAAEENLRQAVRRMGSFLTAEVGPPRDRRFAVVVCGPPSVAEVRLVWQLAAGGAAAITFAGGPTGAVPPELRALGSVLPLDQVAEEAHAELLLGAAEPPALDWARLLAPARNKVVALTAAESHWNGPADVTNVVLQRTPREDELKRQHDEEVRNYFRRNWIISIALIVTVICITNSMLMSVTERFREIGTMKCLGALRSFIRQIFLIESSLLGFVGSFLGGVLGTAFCVLAYGWHYGFGLVLGAFDVSTILLYFAGCLAVGEVLSVLAAVYPAWVASRMLPAHALRTNV